MASSGASGKGLVLRGGATPKRVAARGNEWTPRMAEQFVETLAETCNVTLAAKAIGRSVANVYRRRAKDASFRAGDLADYELGFESGTRMQGRFLRLDTSHRSKACA